MSDATTGDAAPSFDLPTSDGERVTLGSLLEENASGVIVYFYPKAATPGCTTEACDFRDNLAALTGKGYGVVGISADPLDTLTKFSGDNALTFPLASDEDHQVAEAYGAWGEKTMAGKTFFGVKRSTFVVGPDGKLSSAERDVAAQGHVAELRSRLLANA